jgi:glycosyltransferase involved in cell wall biosynthesis
MKVVSVLTTEASGGAEFAAVDMLDALAQRGHETVLITNHPELATGRAVQAREIHLGPKLSRASYRSLMLRWPLYVGRLRHHLAREYPYDVLLLHFKKEQLMAGFLPRRLRPVIAWAEWGRVPQELHTGLPRWAYTTAARQVSAVMTVSESTSDSVCGVGVPRDRVHYVPNALQVDRARFSDAGRARVRADAGIPMDALVIGCVARLHPKKRNDVAVDAVIRLARDDVHLVIAGDGEAKDDLRRRAAPLGNRAHFLPTPGAEIANVFSAFDVAVFCPQPLEGAPLAVIHSMLAARPCVATGPEGVTALIRPGAGTIVAPENDPDAVAEVLREYIDDEPRRAREGAAARAIAERTYAAPVVAERIERLLQVG